MPLFKYKAVNDKGEITNGSSNAQSLESLADILKGQGLYLTEGTVVEEQAVSAPKPAVSPTFVEAVSQMASPTKVNSKEISIFTTQLSIMVRTALPILESLEILSRQNKNPVFKALLLDVARGVREGQPLSKAFARHPDVFDQIYISLLAAGEASGKLDIMMERLSAHLEFRVQLNQKVRSALLYPTIVVMTVVAVVAFLVVFILPTFMEVFSQFDIALPLPTRILIFVSESVRKGWMLWLVAISLGWWYVRRWLTNPTHTKLIHTLQLKIPVAGELVRNVVMTRVLRTLGALTASGVPILKALQLAQASADNVVFHELLGRVFNNVQEGKGLTPALAGSPYVPDAVIGMIATGEKTGTLPDVLNKIAGFYEAETDSSIKNLFSAMEPLFVILLGLVVGAIAVSVLLPMFDLAQGIE